MRKLPLACVLLLSFAFGAEPSLPSVPDTITIRDWIVAGPFPVGTREGITGVVEDPATFRPVEGESLRSSMVQGGVAVCRKVSVDSLGWLETDYQNVRWDSIQDYYGNVGVSCAGFAYAEFECPRACRALAVTPKLGGFTLNGLSYIGDVYGNGWFVTPVPLDSGTNRVLLRLSGYGDQRVRFLLTPTESPLAVIGPDILAPDLVADSALTAWLGIPLVNTTGRRIATVNLRVALASDSVLAETTIRNLPAFGTKKVPLKVTLPAHGYDSTGAVLLVSATPVGDARDAAPATETVRLRIRKPEQGRKVTFAARVDGSCQYYSVTYPKDFDPGKSYALILSLHGAGCEAMGQTDAYKPKDWAFVIAATNRRPYGFDWQDWGRLDAIEVLDLALARYPIDPDRVLLTGHSMGGHGTWHVGLAHAERFAAAAPEAGWPNHQLYVPWFLQRSFTFAEPPQLGIRDMALRPDNAPAMLVNALNLPLYILHGGDDDNVPTIHGRNFAEWLDELGYRYTYKEVPGRPHWWSYEDGLACVDDTDLMAFLKEQKRDAGPRHIRFRTADLGQSNSSFWVTVERVRIVGRDAEIEAWASDSLIKVQTRNVDQFRLDLDGRPFFTGRVAVEIDGHRVGRRHELPAHLTFRQTPKGWALGPARTARLTKTPGLYGPAKQAMMHPFVLIYGTKGDSSLVRFLRHAATQEAVRWWLIGNGTADVLPDTEVTDTTIAKYNLVLYGGPEQNAVTRRIAGVLPIQVRHDRMFLGTTDLGDSLAAMFVYPNPLRPDRLVLVRMGTDPASARLSPFWGVLSSSTGVPDFMVFDRRVRRFGWAGVRAAGFFGTDWNIDAKSMYVAE